MAALHIGSRTLEGADGAWWLPQSSKLVRPDHVGLGGFDSHTFPPGRPRRMRRGSPAFLRGVLLVAAMVALPRVAATQVPDSARVGVPPVSPPTPTLPGATAISDSIARLRDSLVAIGPPIKPKAAFFRSLLVPGWGQMKLDRPTAVAIFGLVEVGSLAMLIQSEIELHHAQAMAGDSLHLSDGTTVPNPYASRVPPRKQAVEDWAFILGFNHLISGLDAAVASALWEVPIQVGMKRDERGTVLYASIPW